MKWGCAIFVGSEMPSPTLLECLDKYIPDHIFKDVVLEPNEFCDNCCIIIDGQGCPACFQFTKDVQLFENLVIRGIPYYKNNVLCTHKIDFFGMLHMKVWFEFYGNFGIDEPFADEEKERITRYVYDLYTFKCDRCEQIQYEGPFCCMYCGTCICKMCKLPNKWGFGIMCLTRLCRVCYTNDQDASIEIIGKKCYIHYGNKKIEYICPIPSRNADYSTKCWKHSIVEK